MQSAIASSRRSGMPGRSAKGELTKTFIMLSRVSCIETRSPACLICECVGSQAASFLRCTSDLSTSQSVFEAPAICHLSATRLLVLLACCTCLPSSQLRFCEVGWTDLSNNAIPLAEERVPLAQHCLVFIFEVIPLRHAVLGFQARLGQGSRGVLAGEDYCCQYTTAPSLWMRDVP